jgi:hypothetical protein
MSYNTSKDSASLLPIGILAQYANQRYYRLRDHDVKGMASIASAIWELELWEADPLFLKRLKVL